MKKGTFNVPAYKFGIMIPNNVYNDNLFDNIKTQKDLQPNVIRTLMENNASIIDFKYIDGLEIKELKKWEFSIIKH